MGNLVDSSGVLVDLMAGRGHFGDAEGDIYVSIENVIGTEFDDVIQVRHAYKSIVNVNDGHFVIILTELHQVVILFKKVST